MTVLDQPHQIAAFRDRCMLMHVRAKARGMNLTRRGAAPTLAAIRREYGIKAKTWADAVSELEAVIAQREESTGMVTGA